MMESKVRLEIFEDPTIATNKANILSLEAMAIAIIALAKQIVPVDEGELRNTLMYITNTTSGGFNDSPGNKAPEDQKIDFKVPKNKAIVGTGSKHWYPEFGTYKMIAQPFLRPAFLFYAKGKKGMDIIKKFNEEEMRKNQKGRVKTGFRII